MSFASPGLRVCFDASVPPTLRLVLRERPDLFEESDAATADVVLFGRDDVNYIDSSTLYRAYPERSLCITETDTPSFRLPGLYAANVKMPFGRQRTRTISYFISEQDRPNLAIRGLVGQSLEKRYLYSFMGGANSWARRRVFRFLRSGPDTLIEATNSYNHWAGDPDIIRRQADQAARYAQVMASSKFALCPRGCGLSSYRLFESMSLGVAPVIIADDWVKIDGIDWSFAFFVGERQVPYLDRLLRRHAGEWQSRGQAARAAYERLLHRDAIAETLRGQIDELRAAYDPRREAIMALYTRYLVGQRDASHFAYTWLKYLVLKGFHLSGRPLPFVLNQPVEEQLGRGPPRAPWAKNS